MRSFPVGAVVAVGAGLVLAPMLIGLPILAYGVGEILGWAHDVEPGPATAPRRLAAGWTAVIVLGCAVVLGVVLGVASVEPLEWALGDDDPAIAATAVMAPLFAGLLFAPLALAPSLALSPALSPSRPPLVVGAVWLAAHRGALRTVALGALLGGLGALPFALAGASALIDDDLIPLALLAGVGLDVLFAPLVLGVVARSFARAREAAEDPTRHASALSALGRLAFAPLLLLASALMLAGATPLPLEEAPELAESDGISVDEGERFALPGTDIRLQLWWRGVDVIDAHQQVQRYRYGRFFGVQRVDVRRGTRRGEDVFVVVLGGHYDGSRRFVLDAEGRRIGDALADRLEARLTMPIVILLVLGCVLGVGFAMRAGRAQARVREIALVARGGDGADRVRGELRVHGAPVIAERGRVRAAGGAWIEAEQGALRIALPDVPTDALAIDPTLPRELPDGTTFVLLSRGARLGGVGLRDARTPWPEGVRFVIGDPARAAAASVRTIFPGVVGMGIAIGALLVVSSIAIAVSTAS